MIKPKYQKVDVDQAEWNKHGDLLCYVSRVVDSRFVPLNLLQVCHIFTEGLVFCHHLPTHNIYFGQVKGGRKELIMTVKGHCF